jgi:uncharacterized phiE125 gp8 family phage protein
LIDQELTMTQTGFCGSIRLPVAPILSITSVSYKQASDGVLTTLASDQYQLVKSVTPHVITQAYEVTWPTPRADFDNVQVVFRAGYGAASTDIPEDIIQAVRLMTGHFYENRQNELAGTIVSRMTIGAERLLMPYRIHI